MSTSSRRPQRPAKRQYGSASTAPRRVQGDSVASTSSLISSTTLANTSKGDVGRISTLLSSSSSTSGPSSDSDTTQGLRSDDKASTPPTSPRLHKPLQSISNDQVKQSLPARTNSKGKERASSVQKGDLRSFFSQVAPTKRYRALRDSDDENEPEPDRHQGTSSHHGRLNKTATPGIKVSRKDVSKPRMEQLYLDPFSSTGHATLSCSSCGMSYARTPDDMALHTKHHKKITGGCEWVSLAAEEACGNVVVVDDSVDWDGSGNGGGRVLMVDANADGIVGRRVKDVLDTIDTELSSASLSNEQLVDCKLFLLVTPQRKVVACAVVQRIREAHEVVDMTAKSAPSVAPGASLNAPSPQFLRFGEEDDGAIFCSSILVPVLLGVHRIWTSSTRRRHGLASILLDASAARSIYGAPIPQSRRAMDVAFSQPTGKGKALARSWTGAANFRVFVE